MVAYTNFNHYWRMLSYESASDRPLYETQILYTSQGTSVTVQDFSHCTRLRTLYPWLVIGIFFHMTISLSIYHLSFYLFMYLSLFHFISVNATLLALSFLPSYICIYLHIKSISYLFINFSLFVKKLSNYRNPYTYI